MTKLKTRPTKKAKVLRFSWWLILVGLAALIGLGVLSVVGSAGEGIAIDKVPSWMSVDPSSALLWRMSLYLGTALYVFHLVQSRFHQGLPDVVFTQGNRHLEQVGFKVFVFIAFYECVLVGSLTTEFAYGR